MALYLWFWNTQHSGLWPSTFDFETHNTQAFSPLPLSLEHTTLGPPALYIWFWNSLRSGLRSFTFDFGTDYSWAFGAIPLILEHTTLGTLALYLWFWNTLDSGLWPSTFDFGTRYTRAFGPLPLILKHTILGPSALYFWFWKASPFGITEATLRLYLTAVCLPWCRKASPLIQKIWRLLGTQNSENTRSTISQCVTPHYELLDRGKIAEYNLHTPPPFYFFSDGKFNFRKIITSNFFVYDKKWPSYDFLKIEHSNFFFVG